VKLQRTLLSLGILLGMGVLLFTAWGSLARREARAAPTCTCALERERCGWCEACGVGYVADTRIPSRELYDALDAHGHDVDAASLECASCRLAARWDGYCETHARGFVGGRAYLSRLAYHVALGEPEAVPEELALLAQALQTVERCERCAAAMMVDGTCPRCRLSYEDGRASPMR